MKDILCNARATDFQVKDKRMGAGARWPPSDAILSWKEVNFIPLPSLLIYKDYEVKKKL